MKNSAITDQLFAQAVEAIDRGDVILLNNLLAQNLRLVSQPLHYPEPGYFQNPYLLWFVADNPIRVDKLPANIVEVTLLIIGFVKNHAADTAQHQFDYALGLVATGRIPKECGVQIAMMDVLIDAGAKPGSGLGALANGNRDAATHLINRGGRLTLATAVGLERMDDIIHLTANADKHQLLLALTVAAFYGKPQMITYLLNSGANPNGYPENNTGFHSHATPLHQAVASGSLACVKLLAEAGAGLNVPDKIYEGTPLGWATHLANDSRDEDAKMNFMLIATYLTDGQNLE
ncbi:ankyrin repeat domain-containing protein [Mucilaginibacter sp. FT3.2]|uniref:ankyrin repeat domain-containing protein n=1 Tax=Mucilaginibacter sp. FT3.2 TaxID=2723090 RepID=UPI0016080349|nr:ankyrin repeat domain-containing protein [Mucilaginibacter sp. FT3.2]MBB6231704.1 peptide-methionine (S)-S-oxide reductase [Mucilaginibacter sp. FT3.2]